MGLFDNGFFGDDLVTATKNGIQGERQKQAEQEEKKYGELQSDPYREITDKEIKDGIERHVAVDGHIGVIAGIRNALAHGSNQLSPSSFTILKRTADLINYLFRTGAQLDDKSCENQKAAV